MDIGSVSNTNATISSANSSGSTTNEAGIMGKNDFLKLFLASLQYQDPMSPMEPKDMMAQMSQLTQVEQITNLGNVINSLKDMMKPDPMTQGMNYLGKQVTGIDEYGQSVSGEVSAIQMSQGTLKLLVNDKYLEIGNLSKVANSASN